MRPRSLAPRFTGDLPPRHPVVGDLDLPYESLPSAAGSSSTLVVYAPDATSPAQGALALLAIWAATEATSQRS